MLSTLVRGSARTLTCQQKDAGKQRKRLGAGTYVDFRRRTLYDGSVFGRFTRVRHGTFYRQECKNGGKYQ
jgi:hypothetical protein